MGEISRRVLLTGGAAMTTMALSPETTAWDFSFTSIEDGTLKLADFRGRVLLVTNTASFCGYTYQYEQLEKLHASLQPGGLTVVGVPSQDFNQESASNAEVKQFCEATFGVEFPMAGLSHVRGAQAHPFYRWVKAAKDWEPQWNFHKVLIGRDGRIRGLFGSADEPAGARLRNAVDAALA
ncbi:glutathione peroxidase [Limobrevibacterium gyesilva]|uniref:Glutathione peroxidase n=1 Tax=Limobrevibacterium gyesilva TaxID=2991712 RepID=A0AA41YVH0_9PROT|nr:glutathione peroxidase [Limobrevibacterium gyesilva]MCW3476142.1 glutathione peroxidase [Limobrevibacterium gyesilva]